MHFSLLFRCFPNSLAVLKDLLQLAHTYGLAPDSGFGFGGGSASGGRNPGRLAVLAAQLEDFLKCMLRNFRFLYTLPHTLHLKLVSEGMMSAGLEAASVLLLVLVRFSMKWCGLNGILWLLSSCGPLEPSMEMTSRLAGFLYLLLIFQRFSTKSVF